MMSDFTAVAKQFVDFYYQTFDANRADLGPLYRDSSMLTFEGTPIQGTTAIVGKLTTLPFQKVQHKITTLDAQPSAANSPNIFIVVTGLLLVDDGTNPLQFTQAFQLVQDGNSYYVLNDMFRLNYG